MRIAEFLVGWAVFLIPLMVAGAIAEWTERPQKKRKSLNVGFKALPIAKQSYFKTNYSMTKRISQQR